jgi:serine/threonine protein kinase
VSSDDCPYALAPGTRILDYTILSVIGTGGFSIVYKAMDNALRRVVAIKEYFPPSFAIRDNDGFVKPHARDVETFRTGIVSFLNEGKLLAQFDHPALVRVYRCWEESGTAYLAMKLYTGDTLRDAVKNGNFVLTQGSMHALLRPLFDTLELLHESQCYHRDVAPDNILLSDAHTPVLLDFGAARKAIEGTQVFTAILKPGYAPIEQYGDGEMKQGPWTDIYALAGVIIFTLTGQPPPTAISRIMKDSMPRPRETFEGRLPESWLDAVECALSVKPENRPQSIAEFREMLGWSNDPFATRVTTGPEFPTARIVSSTTSQPTQNQTKSAPPIATVAQPATMYALDYPATARFDPNVHGKVPVPEDVAADPPAESAPRAKTAERVAPVPLPFAPVESVPPAPVTAPEQKLAPVATPRASTKPPATAEKPRSRPRPEIWIAGLAGVVAVGALAMFLRSGAKSRPPDPVVQPTTPSVVVPAQPTTVTPPPVTAPVVQPQVVVPPPAEVVPPVTNTATPTQTTTPPSRVSPRGDGILDPQKATPTAQSTPAAVPREDRPTKSQSRTAAQKRDAAADDDDSNDEPEASPLGRPTKRPARCVGILQDYGLGTPLSDDDQTFLRNKCK